MLSTWRCLVLSLSLGFVVFAASVSAFPQDLTNDRLTIEFSELMYEDKCTEAVNAKWNFINAPSNETLDAWVKEETAYAFYKQSEIVNAANISENSLHDPSTDYRCKLIRKPGDALLEDKDLEKLITFAGTAEIWRNTVTYEEKTKKLSRQDAERFLSRSGDSDTKRKIYEGWHRELKPLLKNFTEVLPLAQKAAILNDAQDIRVYWETKSDFYNGYEEIKNQWDSFSSLHKKFVDYIHQFLAKKYKDVGNESIAAHLLGSLQGSDWTAISDVTPQAEIIFNMRKNLWKEKLVGQTLYKRASAMSKVLLNAVPEAKFWKESRFDRECPSRLMNFCKSGEMRVSTCFDASLGNYISAYKNVAKIITNQKSEATPILSIANRYPVLEESIAQLFSILSLSPYWLNHTGVASGHSDNDLEMTSLMLTALDVIPRLSYYFSVDMWRIHVIENNITDPEELISSWWKHRLEYENISPSSADFQAPSFLNDPYVTSNKPYLPKIAGIILGFQIYEEVMESTEVRTLPLDRKTLGQHISKMIRATGGEEWMKIIKNFTNIDTISIDALVSYFSPLEGHIDYQEGSEEPVSIIHEEELEKVKMEYFEELIASKTSTTTTPSTTTATLQRNSGPTRRTVSPQKAGNGKGDKSQDKGKLEVSLQSDSSLKKTTNEKEDGKPVKVKNQVFSSDPEEDESKPKINKSKAVWAVGSVLVAVVLIAVIAMFGRQRCRKTPRNRRYV